VNGMPIYAVDIGYGWVKWARGLGERDCGSFLSVVGSPDEAMFSLGLTGESKRLLQPNALVGMSAAKQSTFIAQGRRDQGWVRSDEWYTLFLFALTEMTQAVNIAPSLVVGLPISYYLQDRDWVHDRLAGMHTVQRQGRNQQTVHITDVRVVPQGWGVLLDYVIDDEGAIDPSALSIAAGAIDVGSCTTNILTVDGLDEVPSKSLSVQMGVMDVLAALQKVLDDKCPGLSLRQHKLARAATKKSVRYDGRSVDLSDEVDAICRPMALQVVAAAREHWGDAHGLDVILVAGGGGLLLGPYLREHFSRAIIMPSGVMSNVFGMWKLGRYT
jgi:hypothetical protein